MKYRLGIVVLVGFFTCFSSTSAWALTKWVDADGHVVYSDTPPPGVGGKDIRSSGGGQSTAVPQKSVAEQEADLKKAKQGKEEAQKKEEQKTADNEAKRKSCESARENLRTLESGSRITTVDANGERVFMDDSMIQQRIDEARRVAEQSCN